MFELIIRESGPTWAAQWLGDGGPLGPAFEVQGPDQRRLEEVRLSFQSLFERGSRPRVDPEQVRAMGSVLYDVFFRPVESELNRPRSVGARRLLVRSMIPSFLNLPWELVWLPGADQPIGCDAAWALLRVPVPNSAEPAPPDPGPLRLLFLAAAPEGTVPLDHEREEESLLRATERLGRDVIVLPFAETGGIAELADLVTRHRPHVVHLTGHGFVDLKGTGWFAFEDERGHIAPEPAAEIVSRVFRGSAVRCAVLNGCQTGQSAAAGLAGQLVTNGVSLVLGWGASVIDDTATRFIATFYRFLAAGDRVPAAVAKARQEIWRGCRIKAGEHEAWDATFALPWLFACGADPELIDRSTSPRKYEGPKTELMLLGDDIKGLREGFVGRRRDQQRLIPPLRDGKYTVAVLTGIGGMGKSTLATRTAGRLREAGFEVIGIKAIRCESPAEAGRVLLYEKLLPALARPFLVHQRPVYDAIRDGKVPLEDRIALAVAEWRKQRIALVIDNFEDVLDLETLTIADPGLRTAYRALTRDLTEGSRLLITCRYLPADTPDPAEMPHVHWLDLKDLKEFELVKFLRRDAKVEARMQGGEITWDVVWQIHRLFGGTPGFLVQARALLAHADLDGWDEEVPEDGPIEEKRQRYCEEIMLPRLYGLLSPDSQTLASRLAVSELPLPPDGLARLADRPEVEAEAAARSAAEYGLVQVFPEADKPTVYHVPGLIRKWLRAPDRLSGEGHRAVDRTLAAFWKESHERDRADELRVAIEAVLLACRTHAQRAGRTDEFRWASVELCRHLEPRAEWARARSLLEEVPETARDAATWHWLATLDMNEGDYPSARAKTLKVLAILKDGNTRGESATWHVLGILAMNEGKYPEAEANFRRALVIERTTRDRHGECGTLNQLGLCLFYQGKSAEARPQVEESLKIAQAIQRRDYEASAWNQLGMIDKQEGNYAAAREDFTKSLAISQAEGDKRGEAATRVNLAVLDVELGNGAAARESFSKSLGLLGEIGDKAGAADTLANLAWIDLEEDQYSAAREKFTNACLMYAELRDPAGEARTLQQLATIDYHGSDYLQARTQAAKALDIARRIGEKALVGATLHLLASIDLEERKYPAARVGLQEALTARQEVGDLAGEAATWNQLGFVAWECGAKPEAFRLIALGAHLIRTLGHKDAAIAKENLAEQGEKLGYSADQIEELVKSVADSYWQDRGESLLRAAFPDWP